MSFTLTSLNEALAMEPNSECSVALKVIEIGDTITYKNQQGQERSYYVMKVADEVQVTAIRNYQVRSKTLVNAGKTYAFLNIIRKVGDESFWTTKNTNIIGWVSLNVPDNVMNQTVSTTPENSPRKLNQAIQSGSTSLVKGKIVQTSPKDYRRQGELAIKFVSLKDEESAPAVKVALFGKDAENDYKMGDVISITDTYRYNKSNSLSTKESSNVEFHPSDSVPFEVSDKDFLDDDDFTKKYEPPVTTSFKVMGIASTSIYVCCPNPGCLHRKLTNAVCGKCQKTCLTKNTYYCTADILVMRGTNVSRHTIFHPDIVRLIHDLPELSSFEGKSAELTAFFSNKLPINGTGTFCNGNLRVLSSKRNIPDMD